MKKLLFFFWYFLTAALGSSAQPFDPVLASKLQDAIDSIRTSNNFKGISPHVSYGAVNN